jgi:hypothetical protein
MPEKEELTEREKRVKILVYLGWRNIRFSQVMPDDAIGIHPVEQVDFYQCPNHFNSLDAMQSAIESLDDDVLYILTGNLFDMVAKAPENKGRKLSILGLAAFSTARQRAEAFGKTLNLW